MKKLFYLVLFSTILSLSYSCSSDNNVIGDTEGSNDLYEVSIKISNFSSEIEEMPNSFRSTTDNDNGSIKHLFYQVYDNSNKIVTEVNAIDGDTIIQNLVLKLSKGNYKISVFASNKPFTTLKIKLSGEFDNDWILKSDRALKVEDLSNPCIFQGSIDVNIESSNIQENIVLTRPIGKISLAISDLNKAPDEVLSITPILVRRTVSENQKLYKESGIYLLPQYIEIRDAITTYQDHSTYDESVIPLKSNVYQTITLDRTQFSSIDENMSYDFYLPQTTKSRRLNSYSGGSNAEYDLYLIGSKTKEVQFASVDRPYLATERPDLVNHNVVFMKRIVRNIVIERNKQIIIKGKFFGDDQLNITINDIWDETITNEF